MKASGRSSAAVNPAQPPSTKTCGTSPVARSGGTWKSVSAASSCAFVNVRSRAICSASAKDANDPSAIGISSVHAHARPLIFRPFGDHWTPTSYAPASARAVSPSAFGSSPLITMRVNVWTPFGYGVNGTPASRAAVARSVASTTAFARTAWRPLRLAMTTPATAPFPSFSTSVT